MPSFTQLRLPILMLVAGISVAGCAASPYDRNTRMPYFARGDQVLTAEEAARQRTVVQPRCRQVAEETTPTRGRFVGSGVINGLVGGAIGGAAGQAAYSAIVGGGSLTTAGAAGVLYGIVSGVHGGVQGAARREEVIYHQAQSCNAQSAVGLHQVAPSEGDAIRAGTRQPRSYGRNARPDPDEAAAAATPPRQ